MKSLITVLLLTIIGFSMYPTVSNAYTVAMQEKAAIDELAKKYCEDNKHNPKAWVKLKGSLKIYHCKNM